MTPPVPHSPSSSTASPSPATRTACELFLSLLGLPFEPIEVDLRAGRTEARPDFLRRNAFGQVPVIEDGEHDAGRLQRHPGLPRRALRRRPGALAAARSGRPRPGCSAGCRSRPGRSRHGPAAARVIVLFGLAARPRPRRSRARTRCSRVMEQRAGGSAPSWPARRRRWPTSPTTPTSRTRRKAACRSSPIRTCAPGWRASRRCRASCRWLASRDRAARHERRRCRRIAAGTKASARCRRAPACASAWRRSGTRVIRDYMPDQHRELLRAAAVPDRGQPRPGARSPGPACSPGRRASRIRPIRSTCASTRCRPPAIRSRRRCGRARRSACSASSRTRGGATA